MINNKTFQNIVFKYLRNIEYTEYKQAKEYNFENSNIPHISYFIEIKKNDFYKTYWIMKECIRYRILSNDNYNKLGEIDFERYFINQKSITIKNRSELIEKLKILNNEILNFNDLEETIYNKN